MKKIASLFLIVLIMFSLAACGGKETAESLAKYGEEQFLKNDFEEYLENLRSAGLDDLTVEYTFSYSFDSHYDKENKTLRLRCSFDKLISDKIDEYFTTEYDGAEGLKLARMMDNLKSAYVDKEFTYVLDEIGTVIVYIDRPGYEVVVNTSTDRKYEFEYGYIDTVCMSIDDDWVYYADNEEFYGHTNSQNSQSGNNSANYARHTDSEAFSCAKDILKSYLKSPSTAKFCSFTEAKVTHLGNGEYKVTGWVEAENSFGAMLRQNFTVTYTATSKGYKNGSASVY